MPVRWPGDRGWRSKDRPFREHSTVVLGEDSEGVDKTLVVDGAGRLLRFSLRQGSPGDLHRAPAEDPLAVEGKYVGRLKEALCGTRDAAQLWQKELGSTLKDLGFKDSRLHPGFFYHQGRDIALVSNVDDLLIGGTSEDLVWVRKSIEKKYDIKGTDIENTKDGLKFLGRRIERQGNGYVWSADPKYREILLDEWGLVNANPASTPVATENVGYQGASSGDAEGRCH